MSDEGTGLESRVGALEFDARHVRSDVGEIKTELRRLNDKFDKAIERSDRRLEANRQEFLAENRAIRAEFSERMDAQRAESSKRMDAQRAEFSEGMKAQRAEFSEGMKAQRAEFSEEMKAQRAEFSAEMKAMRAEFSAEIKGIHVEINRIRVWVVTFGFGLAAGILSVMAQAFGWLH